MLTRQRDALNLSSSNGSTEAAHDIERGRTRPTISRLLLSIPDGVYTVVLIVTAMVFVEIAARREWISPLIVPATSDVFQALWNGFSRGLYWEHLSSTLSAMVAGFFLSAVVAISLAALLVSIPRLERINMPIIVAIQSLPKVAITPLVLIWVGFNFQAKILIVAIVCFFPILINTLQGLRSRDVAQVELMRSLGANRWQELWRLRLPNAIPYIFAGLSIGIVFSLIGAVVAEFVGAPEGLGYMMLSAKATYDIPGMYAILLLLMIIGMTLQKLMSFLERRFAPWSMDVSDNAKP